MAFKKINSIYWVHGLFNITNAMLFTTYFLYLTNELHLSYFQATMLDLPVFLVQFLVELPSGFFADRFGLKKSIIIGVLALTIAPLVYCLTTNYILLFINGVLYGIGFAFISGALDALAYETFAKQLKHFLTIRHLIQNVVNVVVPLITIWLVQYLGLRIFYFFDFIFKFSILLFVVMGVKDIRKHYEVPKYGLEFIMSGFRVVKKQLHESKAIYYQAGSQFLWGITSVAVDLFWIKLIEQSAGINSVGVVFSIASLLAILGNLIAFKLKVIKTAFWATFLIHSIFVILAGIFFGSRVAILFVLGRSLFVNIHEVLSSIVINEIIKEDRASMFSFFSFLTLIGKVLTITFIGLVADRWGIGMVWLFAGFILLVISWQLFMVQKHNVKGIP